MLKKWYHAAGSESTLGVDFHFHKHPELSFSHEIGQNAW